MWKCKMSNSSASLRTLSSISMVMRGCVADIAVEAQCHGRAAHQLGSGNGVRAREQGHFMTQSDQFIREVGNNPLGPAIKPRRHTLHERRDLGNLHSCNSWP